MLATTREALLAAVGGELVRDGVGFPFDGVSTDTRKIKRGDLFVALRGATFDGHDFLRDAIDRGAAGVLVARDAANAALESLAGSRGFVVAAEDTLVALGDLAASVVRRSQATVLGITGSTGKTSTKEMIAHVLETRGVVCRTRGNFNNLIGLPLSVFELTSKTQFLVLEMGMSLPGEIARLAEIARPHVGVITNVGAAHLEHLKTIEAVAAAKGELFEALTEDAVAVVNSSDAHVVAAYEKRCRAQRRSFGNLPDDDVRIETVCLSEKGEPQARITLRGQTVNLRLRVMGTHNVWNAAAALAATVDLVREPAEAIAALEDYEGTRDRMERLSHGSVTFVSDCYNANPRSMRAALESVAAVPEVRDRVAVLGDMLELGPEAERAHTELGKLVARLGFDRLFAVGEWAETVRDGAVAAGMQPARVIVAPDVMDVVAPVESSVSAGDWVLVKGSRGLRLERLLQALHLR